MLLAQPASVAQVSKTDTITGSVRSSNRKTDTSNVSILALLASDAQAARQILALSALVAQAQVAD